jgi:hypothetical protein
MLRFGWDICPEGTRPLYSLRDLSSYRPWAGPLGIQTANACKIFTPGYATIFHYILNSLSHFQRKFMSLQP